jgi:membrane protease YdiL (CAAX protease family)
LELQMEVRTVFRRTIAILEVLLVCFVLIRVPGLFIQLQLWQFDLWTMALALLVILLPRRNPGDYGLDFSNWKRDVKIALTAFLPAALAVLPTAFLDSTSWTGALVISVAILLALMVIAWSLRKGLKPIVGIVAIAVTVAGFAIASFLNGRLPSLGTGLANFVTYAVFVGVAEEMLWRGYAQSRLNLAFGKPKQFFGVPVGMGWILASVLFGFAHVLNTNPATGQFGWYWAWGLWTACNGLLLGYVREKTGNILASSILHGLPFGLGRAFGM